MMGYLMHTLSALNFDRILAGERVMSDKFKLTEDHANWVYPPPKSTDKQQQ